MPVHAVIKYDVPRLKCQYDGDALMLTFDLGTYLNIALIGVYNVVFEAESDTKYTHCCF